PKTTSANLYGGPFTIDETTTVRAVAVKDDEKQYSVAVITKSSVTLTLEAALGNADGIVITTDDDVEVEEGKKCADMSLYTTSEDGNKTGVECK
ncbi:MAG: chitobiase/beta-hexosaminidase C-terminal domain-containing protein, partial [Bacteroidales bacterium]|nr:chitobiase/beta-hexosaminidase C-terminal domain-containing protein [Bacteroidales bacterium]